MHTIWHYVINPLQYWGCEFNNRRDQNFAIQNIVNLDELPLLQKFWRKLPNFWGKLVHWFATISNGLKVFWLLNKLDERYLSSIALFHSLRAPSMSLFLSTKVAPRSSKASILSWSRSTLTSSRLTRGSHLLADQLALPDQVLHDVQVTCANNLFLIPFSTILLLVIVVYGALKCHYSAIK